MSDKNFAHESRGQKFPFRFSESVDSLLFSMNTFVWVKLHTLSPLSIRSCMLLIIHMQTSAFTTVEPLCYGHLRDHMKCPDKRGVFIQVRGC